MNIDKTYKKKVVELYFILIFSILVYELLINNPIFLSQILKGAINVKSYVFSIARCFLYVLLILSLKLIYKKLIFHRIEFEEKNHNIMKLIKISLITLLSILIIITVILRIYFSITIISIGVILILLLYLIFLLNFFGNSRIINILMICSLGFLYAITTDIYHPIDEKIHFVGSYNVAHGNLDFENPIFDDSFNNLPGWGNFNLSINYNSKYIENPQPVSDDFEWMPASASKFLYIPSAIGIIIAEKLDGTVIDVFNFGRIFNVFAVLCLIYFILKLLPFKFYSFASILTIPYFLLLSGSYSVDGIGVSIIFLFIAYVLKIYKEKNEIKNINVFFLLILMLAIALYKSAGYCLIYLIILLLPVKQIWKKYKFLILAILVFGIMFLVYRLVPTDINSGDIRGGDTNTLEQIKFLFSSPLVFIRVYFLHVMNTFFNISWWTDFNNIYFYPKLSSWFTIIYLFIFSYIGLRDDTTNFSVKEKIIILSCAFLTFLMTSTGLYLGFTPVGDLIIKGYQARYFWPVFPLLIMLFNFKNIKIKKSKLSDYNMLAILFAINIMYISVDIFSRIILFVI